MNASTSKLLSTALIEDELSKAKAGLAQHCQHQQQPPHSKSHPSSENDNFPTAELKLFRRAKELQHQVESLDLNRSVAKFVSDIVIDKTRNLESGSDTLAVPTLLLNATETCTALGLLLIQHNQKSGYCGEGQQQYLYTALLKWYESIYNSTKTIAVQIFHKQLSQHAPEYPSNQLSSVIISGALSVTTSSSSCYYEWNLASKCLVEVQVVYDALQFSTQKQESSLSSSLPSWRLQIVDEFCQPLADRVRFHFLEEESGGIMSSSAATTVNEGGDNHAVRSLKVDRLPEWLFRYLREVVENHEVHTLVMVESLQPLIDSVINSIIIRAEEGIGGFYDETENDEVLFNVNDEGKSTVGAQRKSLLGADEMFLQLKSQKYNHVSTYFLREVTRMARHVLRAKSFFHHPDVVGSECRDRSIVLRGIEQLFLFDSFVCDKIKDGGVQGGEYDEYGAHEYHQMGNVFLIPPRMVDTFLLMDESLYKWWMDEERDGMIALLRDCASSTLLHLFRSQNEEGEMTVGMDMDNSLRTAERQYPPISELFVALLHAARRKCETISDERCCQMYVADVVSPFCSEYMDLVHDEASWMKKRLLARPPTASSTPGSSVKLLRTANLPSDSLLTWNTLEWSSLITGTHLAAQAILLRQSPSKFDNRPNDILELVGDSMNLLCTAMVDEFTSAFVETIVMERGKMASYMMRAPFLLSHHSPDDNDSPERRSKRDKDASLSNVHFALSPDLNDSIHVLSVGVKTCNKVMGKSMPSLDTNQLSNHLNHGCKSIHDALKFSIGQKLLDIAIDPQGMTPEIYISGAMQFQHDVNTFDRLFRAGGGNGGAEPGPFERAVSASRLMSLELSQIEGIRSALRDLAIRSSAGVGSHYGHGRDVEVENQCAKRLDVDDFFGDERLMNEAVSMLEAKDFGSLSLDEAVSILNRRM